MSILIDDDVRRRVRRLELPFNQHGYDKYGTSTAHLEIFFTALARLYRSYFRVRCFGIQNVPPRGRAMIVGNHSGGYAIDGLLTLGSLFLEMEPPRLAQGMAEKFLSALPVSSLWSGRLGQLTGLPEHAERLLLDERLLMVFPEGARGTAKLYKERHSLVRFGTGFMRLALATKTPIIPFAFIGGGEVLPTVVNLYRLGKVLGVPYVPLTAYGLPIPLPRACEIHFSEPMVFEGTGDEDDEVIDGHVVKVRDRIAQLIDEGKKHYEQAHRPIRSLLPAVFGGRR